MNADREILEKSQQLPNPAKRVEILECTLRDGSYAVDFKFNERDTVVLAGVLARLGFNWIEVGHGVGLGAARAGKGSMPATDEHLIESAKNVAGSAKIGAFFIPGIGAAEDLKSARAAGLDFVRIGYNAPEIEQAYPYIELARNLGLIPCLNFMKTYGVTPQEFATKAKGGETAGAEVVYCVDSAGSMFPEDVRGYVSATRELCDCAIGFHGHSNLQFAVANSVEAFRCGASMIDATLYGLGRSAGNVPTEIAIAVFKNLGIETGIDLFDVMDAAEQFMGPLMSQMQLYDMMSVAMGYSQFHSSFLPKVAAAAKNYGVDLRRLVIAMGKLNPVELNEADLERVARSLPKASRKATVPGEELISFCVPGISEHSISSSLQAIRSLVDGMSVTCAKRRAKPVLELVPSESESPDLVLADLVLAEDTTVVGRVTYGSLDLLEQALKITRDTIAFYLLDLDGGQWGSDHSAVVQKIVGADRVVPIRSRHLRAAFEEELLLCIAERHGNFCLLVYGNPPIESLVRYSEIFRNVAVRGTLPPNAPANAWEIADFSDRMHLDLGLTTALFLCPPTATDAVAVDQLMTSDGIFITAGYFPRLKQDIPHRTILKLDPSQAYRGQVARWTGISTMVTAAQPARLAIAE